MRICCQRGDRSEHAPSAYSGHGEILSAHQTDAQGEARLSRVEEAGVQLGRNRSNFPTEAQPCVETLRSKSLQSRNDLLVTIRLGKKSTTFRKIAIVEIEVS